MKLLYITFIDFGDFSSGSRVRPQRLYQAFLDVGVEVKLLEGQQNRLQMRRRRVMEVLSWLKKNRPDICYIESPTGPFFNGIDLKLIKKIHKMGIPIGFFYRDAYWKLAEWWPVQGLKRWVLRWMHKRDLRVFRDCCDIIYFPSETMADLFDFSRKELLPPGSDIKEQVRGSEITRIAIYVGGVSPVFGTEILFDAFEKINYYGEKAHLILVTREEHKVNIPEHLLDQKWLEVHYTSGDMLPQLYKRADVSLLPRNHDFYMELAVPVKLFEYIGFGLPVIATDSKETTKIINRYGCGLVCESSADAFADAVETYYESQQIKRDCQEGVKKALAENQWKNRAEKVIEQLTSIKSMQR